MAYRSLIVRVGLIYCVLSSASASVSVYVGGLGFNAVMGVLVMVTVMSTFSYGQWYRHKTSRRAISKLVERSDRIINGT